MPIRQKGFTLIELMIAVAIVGILAGIAVPQYGRYVTEARRTDGHIALRAAVQMMERCRSRTFNYSAATCTGPVTDLPSDEGNYTVRLDNSSPTAYTLTAVAAPDGPQANDTDCVTMSIDQFGTTSPEACW